MIVARASCRVIYGRGRPCHFIAFRRGPHWLAVAVEFFDSPKNLASLRGFFAASPTATICRWLRSMYFLGHALHVVSGDRLYLLRVNVPVAAGRL